MSWPDSTIIAPVTAYHQRSCVETYRRSSRASSCFCLTLSFPSSSGRGLYHRVRGSPGPVGPRTPALSQREREPKPLAAQGPACRLHHFVVPWETAAGTVSPVSKAPCMPRGEWNLQKKRSSPEGGKVISTSTVPFGGRSLSSPWAGRLSPSLGPSRPCHSLRRAGPSAHGPVQPSPWLRLATYGGQRYAHARTRAGTPWRSFCAC